MRIGLLTDLAGQRTWHRWLSTDLARLGHDLVIVRPASEAMQSCPSSLQLALWLDPVVFKLKGERAFDLLAKEVIAERAASSVPGGEILDVLIDASSGTGSKPKARRVIRLLFNSEASELAAVSAVLDPWPIILTMDNGSGADLETARPGIEQRGCLSSALDNLFSGVVELLVERIQVAEDGRAKISDEPVTTIWEHYPKLGEFAGVRYVANVVAKKILSYLDRHSRTKMSWAIATRNCAGPGLVAGPWPSTAIYDVVADDGHRFFADPFLFECDGRTHIFAEEFPLATGRGIISVAEIDERGRVGAFRPVLERQCHLSYPFVFAHAGEIWMIPEACGSGSVELFRAVEYPNRWEFDRKLLEGVAGCDPTITQFGGMYFMHLTATRWRGSTWDKQRVFYAGSPLGPWKELAGGLVRIDCTNSRPAGASIFVGGRLLRPTQNCSRVYGGSMTLLEVQHLSATRCHEVPLATIKVVDRCGDEGTHTYSKSRLVEAVDVYREVPMSRQVKLQCAPTFSGTARSSLPEPPPKLETIT